MAFCTKCGKPLSDGVKFCNNCGNPVKETAAAQADQVIQQLAEQTPQIKSEPIVVKQTLPTGQGFFSKHKIGILAGGVTLVLIVAVYFLFFKPNPEKDGKMIGAMICTCREDSSKFSTQTLKEFKNGFDSRQFKSRLLATTFLNSVYSDTKDRFDSCYKAAMKKFADKGKKFSGNGNLYKKFESAFSEKQTSCTVPTSIEFVSIQNDLTQKINALMEPEPTVEKIKNDLLGQSMLGWNFDYLEEFQKCEISKKTNTTNGIEYVLDMRLLDKNQNSLHDASATIVYDLKDGKWGLNNIVSHYITYTFRATAENWLQVNPLSNCTYTISPDTRYWVKDGQQGQTFKGGGSDSESFTLVSNTIFLASRETSPVNVVFTFYPKQN